jgi:ATP-dependent Clp endopeptidase proteolytic subunit ClpP
MKYCINPTDENPIFIINGLIGVQPDGSGVDGALWQNEFMQVDAMQPKKISVWINSGGGSVVDGYNIYNAITASKSNVDTYCYGVAASMAAIIFQAGRNRVMSDIGVMMLHNPYSSSNVANVDMISAIREGLINAVVSKCGKTKDEVSAIFDKTTWFTAQSCMDNGMCDSIFVSGLNKKIKPSAETIEALVDDYELILNSYIKKEKKMELNQVKAFLKLDEVSEDTIINAVKSKDSEIESLKNSYDIVFSELTELKASIENENKNKQALELVENAIKEGKVSEGCKDAFVELALNYFDATKKAIEAMEVNKVANKVTIAPATVEGRDKWTIRDWEKNDSKGLEKIKNENPELYNQLYSSYYKK